MALPDLLLKTRQKHVLKTISLLLGKPQTKEECSNQVLHILVYSKFKVHVFELNSTVAGWILLR